MCVCRTGLKLPNVFGRGERLAAEYSLGHRSSSNFSVVAAKPLPLRVLAPLLSGTVYQQTHEAPWSGYRCVERGLLLEAAFRTGALTDHRLQWEGQVYIPGVPTVYQLSLRLDGPAVYIVLQY